ncbi:hypothetical protein E0H22_07125 [Rhodopseudomonas boonkerdii]|uniref:hypothetical protein n=1 Tax=Rhodopseudomonas boonkerdii TaxID=475937 RepID=UPI001E28E92E|nr:hypothetical protein [Rhodopseudomonas boonkerdii]UGV25478.1 hypothetical protein E0H22_07125 [Rhodopseudomonas boonkerdii]
MNDPTFSQARRAKRPQWLRVFGVPIVIGVLSLAGLLSALLAGDPGRYFSWFGVGLPVAIAAWTYWRNS